ncbi:MAG: peptidase glycoprotease [Myxococcales bacterium]|nr:peptidase glycoprotease [Myxococcales bacterium]
MKVLALDTATLTASIALVEDARVLAGATHDSAGRKADLLVVIDELCREAGVAPTELDAIAIGAGPGSFTGLRIGMATAKGIAFAAKRPLWAVSTLAALASEGGAGLVIGVLDARRGEVFAGCYRDGVLAAPERVLPPAELAAWIATLGEPARFVGDALAVHPELSPFADRWQHATPSAAAVARLALAGARVDVVTTGSPAYIRMAEAELKYPDGIPGALRKR